MNKKVIKIDEDTYQFMTSKIAQDFDGNDITVLDQSYTKTISELNGVIGVAKAQIEEAQADLDLINALPEEATSVTKQPTENIKSIPEEVQLEDNITP